MSANAAFQHAANNKCMRFALSVSFFEIYNETVSDLLGGGIATAPPTVAACGSGAFDVVGLSEVPVSDVDAVQRLILRGSRRRTTGSSYKHDASSRSHCLLRLRLASQCWDGSLRVSQFTLVDLAGAELLAAAPSTTNAQETKNINLSLLTLRSVISALARGASHVPFRESTLTKLLSNALGGNSRTAILCTCSPAEADAGFTLRTLRFGQVVRKLRTRLASALYAPPQGAALRAEVDVATHEVALEGGAAAAEATQLMKDIHSSEFPMQRTVVSTCAGDLSVWYALQAPPVVTGEPPQPGQASTQVALLMHAYGSSCSGLDMQGMGSALYAAGYSVVMPDLPGFGTHESGLLKKCSGRTEKMNVQGGPLPAICELLAAFGVIPRRRAVAYGFDFGGTLCLGLACTPPKQRLVRALSVFHANWTSDFAPLNAVSIPVQVLWLTVDQNHPVAVGAKLARALPKATLVKLKASFFKAGLGGGDDVQAQLVQRTCDAFGEPSMPPPQAGSKGPPQSRGAAAAAAESKYDDSPTKEIPTGDESDSKLSDAVGELWMHAPPAGQGFPEGDCGLVAACDDCPLMQLLLDQSALGMVRGGPTRAAQAAAAAASEAAQAGHAALDMAVFRPLAGEDDRSARWAVRVLLDLHGRGQLPAVLESYLTSGSSKPQAVALLSSLPLIAPDSSAAELEQCGLWGGVSLPSTAAVAAWPRFPSGRQVLVRALVCIDLQSPEQAFLAPLNAADGGMLTVTHKAWVQTVHQSAAQATVSLGSPSAAHCVKVPLDELITLNCATDFRTSVRGGFVFEDGVECKYASLLMRGLLARCAASVAHLLPDIANMWQEVSETGVSDSDSDSAVAAAVPHDARSVAVQRGTAAQAAAAAAIAVAMNCTHIPNDGMQVGRCRLPDVGRLAHFGQGHCHTQASVTAALLLAFAGKLGWDVKFRGGSVMPRPGKVGASRGAGVLWEADQHTWCEVTLLPSCDSLVLDATFKETGAPMQQAYSREGRRHVMWGSMCDCNALPAQCDVLQ